MIDKDSHLSPFLKLGENSEHLDHEATEMGFTNTLGSGETYDLILTADDKRGVIQKIYCKWARWVPFSL